MKKKCNCGINTPLIGKIAGRKADSIILPSGKIIPPSSITGIPAKVMEELNTKKILQFQILQKSIDKVEVLVVIDEEQRDKEPSIDILFKKLKEKFEARFGGEVEVEIKEVKEIKRPERLATPPPVVTSMVRVS
ncbi:MAG TPA: hypothetical protein ENG71_03625 [Thermoplasmatales archaeon]|nr:hypothetical protein [Thermoplasmatales archaeon]